MYPIPPPKSLLYSHVMIPRGPVLDAFTVRLRDHNVSSRVMIDDVSALIRRRESEAEQETVDNESEKWKKEGTEEEKVLYVAKLIIIRINHSKD